MQPGPISVRRKIRARSGIQVSCSIPSDDQGYVMDTDQYLNPPLSPMLIIDREGNVHHLEYGLKDEETLQKAVAS